MPCSYRQLGLAERRTIFHLLNAKVPPVVIAEQLGRHRSTTHREIRRNHFHAFARYWGFRPKACAPYRARTKGKDEHQQGVFA